MRLLLLGIMVLLASASDGVAQSPDLKPASRSEAEGACHAVMPTDQVLVSTAAGDTVRGTLMCLSEARVWILRDGRMSRIDLDRVRRIRTLADPVWDGALKGVIPPLLIWALLCRGDCPVEPFLRMSLTFGAIGLVGDAIDTNRRTLYRATPSFRVGWNVKF